MTKPARQLLPSAVDAVLRPLLRGALFRKYILLFTSVMGLALIANSLVNIWSAYREHRANLIRFQSEQAASAASKISQFIQEIESQLGWTTHLSWVEPATEQRELDGLRLLRQVPAITELAMLDDKGREQLRLSRQAMNRIASGEDYSRDERFTTAMARRVYHGPIQFRRETEPYMTLAIAGVRRGTGVSVAEVNLKHIWDVVHQIRVGQRGRAFVVDARGRLIAHPDISLVLRNTDLSMLPQVRAARSGGGTTPRTPTEVTFDLDGNRVLTAHAPIEALNWLVFIELPEQEANAPLYAALTHTLLVLLIGLALALATALVLARRMIVPIQELTAGAERIGSGGLDHRISIHTGDELEVLGDRFNAMASHLQTSYATLERKVEERTHQLAVANQSRSRFLAIASHDLRQPLHALNLLVAQMKLETDEARRQHVAGQIDAAVGNMNELFNVLLDISKLDAGGVVPAMGTFPIASILRLIETTFAAAARDKGLHFSVVESSLVVRSDPVLLGRILQNLVSNAVRYTSDGGVVVGCRRARGQLRIDVCDTGVGIAEQQQKNIFEEFYRVAGVDRDREEAMGLGLAIVKRLANLLEHPIELVSIPGRGSRFSLRVPAVPGAEIVVSAPPAAAHPAAIDSLRGQMIAVIDDDRLVREGTHGLLESWGCRVVAAATCAETIAALGGRPPDLIISDFHLGDGGTGPDAIRHLRRLSRTEVPAFLISGDVSPDRLRDAQAAGLRLLHKPVSPMALRSMLAQLLKEGAVRRQMQSDS